MNSRIKQFMEHKGISSSELADTIGVQRSNVTHVLHGRNKPSFQFISKLLETYPEINAKWLIMGSGNMLENQNSDQVQPQPQSQPQLFDKAEPVDHLKKDDKEMDDISVPQQLLSSFNAPVSSPEPTKEIEKIVVFYSDQTFKEYGPAK